MNKCQSSHCGDLFWSVPMNLHQEMVGTGQSSCTLSELWVFILELLQAFVHLHSFLLVMEARTRALLSPSSGCFTWSWIPFTIPVRYRTAPYHRGRTVTLPGQWAALGAISLEDICAAASWLTRRTLSRFYNVDVATPPIPWVWCFGLLRLFSEVGVWDSSWLNWN